MCRKRPKDCRVGQPWSGVPISRSVTERRRLVLVVNHAAFLVSHRLPILLRARDEGWHVTAAASSCAVEHDASALDVLRSHNVDFAELPMSRSGRNPLDEFVAYRSLKALYRQIQPTVVHHVTIKPVIYGSRAARREGVPGVLNAVAGLGSLFLDDSLSGSLQRRVVLAMYRRAVMHPNLVMLFQNDNDAQVFEALRLGSHAQRAVIRGSGVDLDVFKQTPSPDEERLLVIFPARILHDKGVREFVAAAEMLRAEGSNARFAIVGAEDANPSAASQNELTEWRARGAVELWGYRSDMPSVYTQCAIVCLPSYREGLPKALLEAAACGRAVVTTDVPGCRDAVDAESAVLVRPRDAAALAGALRALLVDRGRRERMGAAGRRLAERRFSVHAVADATIAIYNQLVRTAA